MHVLQTIGSSSSRGSSSPSMCCHKTIKKKETLFFLWMKMEPLLRSIVQMVSHTHRPRDYSPKQTQPVVVIITEVFT